MKPGSQAARMLELLSDRRGHSHLELAHIGVGRPNNRRRDLEKAGYVVTCTPERDSLTKQRVYVYRLLSVPQKTSSPPAASASAGPGTPGSDPGHHGEIEDVEAPRLAPAASSAGEGPAVLSPELSQDAASTGETEEPGETIAPGSSPGLVAADGIVALLERHGWAELEDGAQEQLFDEAAA